MKESQSPESDDDDLIFFNSDLFINKEYEKCSFEIDINECPVTTLYCSTSAMTDHDLTGQIVWPVSVYLSYFIASNKDLFKDKVVLEVGAGAALPSFVAANYCSQVIITDGNDIVLEMLEQSAAEQPNSHLISCTCLRWGENVETIASKYSPNVIIGADVICWPKLVLPLLQSVKYLFQSSAVTDASSTFVFYCGFVCRASSTEVLLRRTAASLGFSVSRISSDSFLPSPVPRNVESNLELQLLAFEYNVNVNEPLVRFTQDLESLQTAC